MLRDKLDRWDDPAILYEVIPPAKNVPEETVRDTTLFIEKLLKHHDLDAINVPEIREEDQNGQRVAGYMKKIDPRVYGAMLREQLPDVDVVVNHVVVHDPLEDQVDWFRDTFADRGFRNVVIVGGESSEVDYPGPSVPEAADVAWKVADELGIDDEVTVGGITIPTRDGEVERILAKQRHGIGFFTSQVIFEAESSKRLLADYHRAVREADVEPATFFLSFAPITGRKDLEFLRWLGVEIPEPTEEWILAPEARSLERSVRAAEHVLRDVLAFAHRNGIDVPIGLNVEHIMRYNFDASEILLDHLTTLFDWIERQRSSDYWNR